METISLWSSHFEGILWILSRIPLDSLRTLTWPTQTIHFTITDSTHLQFSCSGLSNRHERRKRQSPSEKGKKSHPLHIPDLPIRGQPSIYFPIRDHVNVSWCRSHTNASGVISTSHIVASHITKLLLSFRQILQFRFWDNPQGRIPPWKVTKTRQFLSTCYGDPSATEVPPCCEAATKKLTFSTISVLLLLNMPLSLSRGTLFRRQKNPRRVYRPKIAGILFVCNEPEGKYYTVP